MTTGNPTLSKKIYTECLKKECFVLDAPIIGDEALVKEKKALIVVGGDRQIYKGLIPIFFIMCKSVNYCGPSGYGQHTKLSNQIVMALNMIGIVESLLYAYKAGLDINITIHSIITGTASSWCYSNYTRRMETRDFDAGLFVKYFVCDLENALKESYKMGISLPGLSLAKQLYLSLKAQGNENKGIQSLLLAFESFNNTKIERKIEKEYTIANTLL